MRILALTIAALMLSTQAYSYEKQDLNSGMWDVKWNSNIQDLGPHFYMADASNLIYQVSHISEQCYIREQDAQKEDNVKIFCYKNNKFMTTLEFQKGINHYQDAKNYYQDIASNPQAAIRKDMLNEFISYQIPTTQYDQLITTVSYSRQKDMSLVIVNNLALLKQNVTPEEKQYMQ